MAWRRTYELGQPVYLLGDYKLYKRWRGQGGDRSFAWYVEYQGDVVSRVLTLKEAKATAVAHRKRQEEPAQ